MVVSRLSTHTRSSLVSAIKSFTSNKYLPSGKPVHAQIIKLGFLPETQLFNHLVNFYAKSSDFSSAQKVFDEIPEKNLVSFCTLISGYSQSNTPRYSLDLVPHLQNLGLSLNEFVFSSLILSCSKLKRVDEGKQIHALVIVSDFESDPFVKTSLVDMYSKFDDLDSAISLFNSSPIGDPVLYNSMISGLVTFCSYEEAIELFVEARRAIDLRPTEFTFGSIIKACSNFSKEVGKQMHGFILKTGLESNCFVGTSLIDMYGKLGDMESLIKIFMSITSIDLTLYNSMIAGFSNNGHHETALRFFGELKLQGFSPDGSTFSSVLKACGGLNHIELGRIIHGAVLKSVFQRDLVINTALIDMYIKCGHIEKSCRLFESMPERNAVVYNSMICGHGDTGNFVKAISLFVDMSRKRIDPNHATFVALLNSCSGHERSIYPHVIKRGFGCDLTVQNALLDGLIKDGAVAESQWFFNKMHERDVVSWTTVISGLSQLGMHSDALELFKDMQFLGVCPNSFTLSSVLKACGSLVDLGKGKCIHGCSVKHGIIDEFIDSALLDMYANCGAFEESSRLFDVSSKVDVVSWNAMITGCAQHGNGHEALNIFESMMEHGVEPNQVTFTSLLSSCSHCGLVDDGVRVFESISCKYGMIPSIEHYACMVDMFGRAGMLDRAKLLIENMPFRPDISIWNTFLASCKLHGDVTLAQLAKDHILGMEGQDTTSVILMSNIYSEVGQWDDVEKLRRRIKDRGGRKEPGLSWVQIKETDKSCAL
ncbi:pentatricopeptide repeat-containing protein At4g13650-like [Macadamia integrifolia]|uniref:pentatricopeptide repeat-containing protein At4g13650-like n=1 Tax=Macadamia integrifolia TaxID=60698 RepID=UPI001C501FE4|nr:pentatricopeptide repeat-containing protein At4g13650-like [Macadamia integrifolia]XP_042500133.1 pentatricopeptide repeat-containing protein At4g13650-like [Macadamia integrifolia]XP_042500134.1 pentatricopeptide repeat-containing protein At4g13650-like [Macadamia integrifolia]XP_042500135.1 pentatricopeptide repeat-containing protein At4g13650-like [Macadamia integrifolia]XP_042500136.1 pentatricopeptide repeat-containing protein At4g13650-like [Macadamia integrifolia]XP_042500137.1 penta